MITFRCYRLSLCDLKKFTPDLCLQVSSSLRLQTGLESPEPLLCLLLVAQRTEGYSTDVNNLLTGPAAFSSLSPPFPSCWCRGSPSAFSASPPVVSATPPSSGVAPAEPPPAPNHRSHTLTALFVCVQVCVFFPSVCVCVC